MGGGGVPSKQLPGSGGACAPHVIAKRLPKNCDTKYHKMLGVVESHREGDAGSQGIHRDQQWVNPPGTNRDLGAGRGHKRGDERTWDMVADACTRRRTQRRAAKDGGWRG